MDVCLGALPSSGYGLPPTVLTLSGRVRRPKLSKTTKSAIRISASRFRYCSYRKAWENTDGQPIIGSNKDMLYADVYIG